ncbi:uncharacterized protein V1478_010461 [Vespula squamosa]|uniref:Uncharacterized protein n=1 Tax=Vespula squamosa TaxID=30214 RepID=A0ABD2AI37_VESSQ
MSFITETEEAETGAEKVARAWTRLETVTLLHGRSKVYVEGKRRKENLRLAFQVEEEFRSSVRIESERNFDVGSRKKIRKRYARASARVLPPFTHSFCCRYIHARTSEVRH